MSETSVNTSFKACRICLDTKYSRGVSFDDGGWLKMYEYCFGLIVTSQDTPRQLCGGCAQKMQDFAEFKKRSCNANKLWRTTISVNMSIKNICLIGTEEKFVIKEEEDSDVLCDNNIDDISTSIKEENPLFIKETGEICSISLPLTKESLQVNVKEENSTKGSRKKHKKSKNEEKNIVKSNFVCQWCKKSFKLAGHFKTHQIKNKCRFIHNTITVAYSKKKTKDAMYYCGLCDEKSPNAAYINDHILNVHSSISDLSCKLCDYTGRDFADMESHRYTHQPNVSTELKCSSCNQVCRTSISLQFHYRSKHLNKPGGWCSVCNKIFRGYYSFRNHEKLHKTPRFICHHCGLKFLVRSAIIYHMTEQHVEYKGFMCDVCGKKFKRKSNLRLHMLTVHDNVVVKCTHCNRKFKNKETLRLHLLREGREKKYQCDVCSRLFLTEKMLSQHIIWHNDERPYACELCGSTYKVKSQLTIHKRKHTGILPYKCTAPQCIRSFASSSQLKVHLTVHSGIRRYKCDYCEKTFHNKSNVISHCNKRHNITGVELMKSSELKNISK